MTLLSFDRRTQGGAHGEFYDVSSSHAALSWEVRAPADDGQMVFGDDTADQDFGPAPMPIYAQLIESKNDETQVEEEGVQQIPDDLEVPILDLAIGSGGERIPGIEVKAWMGMPSLKMAGDVYDRLQNLYTGLTPNQKQKVVAEFAALNRRLAAMRPFSHPDANVAKVVQSRTAAAAADQLMDQLSEEFSAAWREDPNRVAMVEPRILNIASQSELPPKGLREIALRAPSPLEANRRLVAMWASSRWMSNPDNRATLNAWIAKHPNVAPSRLEKLALQCSSLQEARKYIQQAALAAPAFQEPPWMKDPRAQDRRAQIYEKFQRAADLTPAQQQKLADKISASTSYTETLITTDVTVTEFRKKNEAAQADLPAPHVSPGKPANRSTKPPESPSPSSPSISAAHEHPASAIDWKSTPKGRAVLEALEMRREKISSEKFIELTQGVTAASSADAANKLLDDTDTTFFNPHRPLQDQLSPPSP